jgi:hypothetical protein
MKKLPEPDLLGTGSSFQVVAGVRYEAQERKRRMEVVRVRFTRLRSAWAPAREVCPDGAARQSAA